MSNESMSLSSGASENHVLSISVRAVDGLSGASSVSVSQTDDGEPSVSGATTNDALVSSGNDLFTMQREVLQPFLYMAGLPGKNIRKELSEAFNLWLQVPPAELCLINEIVAMIHNASLIIDDIEDNSVLRREKPTAHTIFGTPLTMNAGTLAMLMALDKCSQLHPDASKLGIHYLIELHRGQGMDIYFRDSFVCPTEEKYREMVRRKTGALFRLGVSLMALVSPLKPDPDQYNPLLDILGMYYQIRDDYCNMGASQSYAEKKTYCEDLTEGKFNFLIIHAVRQHQDDERILHILRQRTTNMEVKKYCVKLLEEFGSFDYATSEMSRLDEAAGSEIEKMGGNPLLLKFLEKLRKTD